MAKIEETHRMTHVRLRLLAEGAAYFFYDNENSEPIIIHISQRSETRSSIDLRMGLEQLHRFREALDLFDDRMLLEAKRESEIAQSLRFANQHE